MATYVQPAPNPGANPAPSEKSEKLKKAIESAKQFLKIVGGVPPQMVSSVTKPPAKSEAKVPAEPRVPNRWVYRPFINEARTDKLLLRRWQKELDANQPYPFAKLGRKIEIPKYTEKEYDEYLSELNPSWSKEETALLWELCEMYELRFTVIADRFAAHQEYKRSIEELKDRYFSIAKKLLEQRGESSNQLVKRPYSLDYEVKRKANLEKIFLRIAEHQSVEKQLLEDVKKIEQRIKREEKELKNLNKLMGKEEPTEGGEPDTFTAYRRSTFLTKAAQAVKPQPFAVVSAGEMSPGMSPTGRGGRRDRGSGVYLRSQLMNAPLPVPDKAQKKLDQVLKELGVPEKLTPTAAVVKLYDQLRKEALTLLSLEKHIQKKSKEKQVLEAKWEEYQKRMKSVPPSAPGMMPGNPVQPMGMMMSNSSAMPPPSGHMMNPAGVPYGQGMPPGHMQQMPPQGMAGMHHGHGAYSAQPMMSMPAATPIPRPGQPPHAPRTHRAQGQPYEAEKTGEGSSTAGHQRATQPPQPQPQPVPQPAAEVTVKSERPEDSVKVEEKSEGGPEKKKSKRKPRSERKSKRAQAEGSAAEGGSSDKKKKKY